MKAIYITISEDFFNDGLFVVRTDANDWLTQSFQSESEQLCVSYAKKNFPNHQVVIL